MEKFTNLVTHSGTFHADDVLAVALFKYFKKDEKFNVIRIPHNTTTFEKDDILIDIGLEYDGVSKFDHHQYKHGMSACALIWINIKQSCKVSSSYIDQLVKEVSDADVGLDKQSQWHYSGLIAKMNNRNPNDDAEQYKRFMSAVDYTNVIIDSVYSDSLEMAYTEKWIKEAPIVNKVLKLPKYLRGWNNVVCEINKPKVTIELVIWPSLKNESDESWYIQVVPVNPNSYDLVREPLLFSRQNNMRFIHPNGFLGVANNYDELKRYLSYIGIEI